MGVFSKKILLATDGSEEAELAARTATEPAEKTGSELHEVYAQPIPLPVDPSPDDPFPDIIGPHASEVIKDIKEKAQRLLDAQVQQVRAVGRRSASPSEDRRYRRRDCHLSRGNRGWADTAGEPRTGRSRTGPNGQRFRIRRPPRPLPGFGGSRYPARVAGEEDRTDVWRSLSKQSGAPAMQKHHS